MRSHTLLLTAGIAYFVALPAVPATAQEEAHREKTEHSPRWAIRNGLDSGAKTIAHSARSTTIASLTKAERPVKLPADARVPSTETALWQVEGDLVRYEKHDDGDIQFVLRDKTGSTLVCEVPDPDEVRASPFIREVVKARSTFTKRFSPTMTTHEIAPMTVRLRVVGLGYFGRISPKGKPGLPNGLQLHPVTNVIVLPRK